MSRVQLALNVDDLDEAVDLLLQAVRHRAGQATSRLRQLRHRRAAAQARADREPRPGRLAQPPRRRGGDTDTRRRRADPARRRRAGLRRRARTRPAATPSRTSSGSRARPTASSGRSTPSSPTARPSASTTARPAAPTTPPPKAPSPPPSRPRAADSKDTNDEPLPAARPRPRAATRSAPPGRHGAPRGDRPLLQTDGAVPTARRPTSHPGRSSGVRVLRQYMAAESLPGLRREQCRRANGSGAGSSDPAPLVSFRGSSDLVLVAAAPGEGVDLERRGERHAHPGAAHPAEPLEHLPLVEVLPAEAVDVGAVRLQRLDADVERLGGVDAVPRRAGSRPPTPRVRRPTSRARRRAARGRSTGWRRRGRRRGRRGRRPCGRPG